MKKASLLLAFSLLSVSLTYGQRNSSRMTHTFLDFGYRFHYSSSKYLDEDTKGVLLLRGNGLGLHYRRVLPTGLVLGLKGSVFFPSYLSVTENTRSFNSASGHLTGFIYKIGGEVGYAIISTPKKLFNLNLGVSFLSNNFSLLSTTDEERDQGNNYGVSLDGSVQYTYLFHPKWGLHGILDGGFAPALKTRGGNYLQSSNRNLTLTLGFSYAFP